MRNKRNLLSLLMISLVSAISGCGIKIEFQEQTEDLTAPPVEGEDSAPPMEASAEEIMIEQLTPNGVMAMAEDNLSLAVFNAEGKQLDFMQAPGIGSGDPQNLHLAGSWSENTPLPPLIYRGWEPEQAILQSVNGIASSLRTTDAFLSMAGAEGQPAFAFSEVALDANAPHSYLYAGTPDSIDSATAFYEMKDDQMVMALQPVAVDAVGGQPQGVWYTQTAWGIGGVDLIFPINQGLFFFDLTSGENLQALDNTRNFQGISPDRQWAASVEFDYVGNKALTVRNLETGQSVTFALHPASDRGAGYAVFSPDGQYAAWLEAGGSLLGDPPFHPRVRVGDTASGGVVAETDSVAATQVLGWGTVSFLKPAGFLDAQTVVIEARGEEWGTVALLKYGFATGSLSVLCQGSFAGFVYP